MLFSFSSCSVQFSLVHAIYRKNRETFNTLENWTLRKGGRFWEVVVTRGSTVVIFPIFLSSNPLIIHDPSIVRVKRQNNFILT